MGLIAILGLLLKGSECPKFHKVVDIARRHLLLPEEKIGEEEILLASERGPIEATLRTRARGMARW